MSRSNAKYAEAERTARATVRFPAPELDAVDQLVDDGKYLDRSEAIRHAVREFIERHEYDHDQDNEESA